MKELKNHPQYQKRTRSQQLEARMLSITKKRAEDKRAKTQVSNTTAGVVLREELVDLVKQELEASLKPYDEQGKGNKPRWYKPLRAVDTRLTANLAVNCFIDAAGNGWKLTKAREQTGKAFVALMFEQLVYGTNDRIKMFERFKQRMMKKLGDVYRRVDMFHARAESMGFEIEKYQDKGVLQSIGNELLNCVTLAGFLTYKKERKSGDINATRYLMIAEEIKEQLRQKNIKLDLMSPYYGMIAEKPNQWRRHPDGWSRSGPYSAPRLNYPLQVVRHMGEPQKQEIEERIDTGRFEKALTALHTIQETPLRMNPYVIDAVQFVIDNDKGGELSGWPNIKEIDTVSFNGTDYDVNKNMPDEDWAALDDDAQKDFVRARRDLIEANMAAGGNETNLFRYVDNDDDNPGEANLLLQEPELFAPESFDTRGRIYPVTTMNHHDADYLRAMFLFGKSWEVTEENLSWLIIQLANTYGNKVDKMPHKQLGVWLGEFEEEIRLCGRDIEASFYIWKTADEPFQFLAACHEYENYMAATERGETYRSSLPIAVDASQSGVQHFALSLRDPRDAKRVNLGRGDTRHDIYEDCLVVAKRLMEEDKAHMTLLAANDPVTDEDRAAKKQFDASIRLAMQDDDTPIAEIKRMRRRWNNSAPRRRLRREKHLEVIEQVKLWTGDNKPLSYGRSVIKRNVMTYCYSSRQFGFAEQLRTDWMDKLSELVRHGKLDAHPFGQDKGFAASTYIAGVHERAIEEVVESAKRGMEFIQDVVRILATHGINAEDFEVKEPEEGEDEKRTHNPQGIHLRFLTPHINFPFYQNYVKELQVRTELSFFDRVLDKWRTDDVSLQDTDPTELWVEKSINACSPNLIHAMDATHLMMTVNDLASRGVTDIMTVHDSFACGIGDMDELSACLRENMVKLYKDYNLYEDLLNQAKALHPNPDTVDWPDLPYMGDEDGNLFDIEEVLDSLRSFM